MKIITNVFLLLMLIVCLVPYASAVDNQYIGQLQISDFNDINVYSANYLVTAPNVLVDNTDGVINMTTSTGTKGQMYLTGIYPTTECTYNIELKMLASSQLSQIFMSNSIQYLSFQKYTSSYLIKSYYTNDTGTLLSSSFSIPISNIDDHINISISNDESNRTNTIRYNDTLYVTTVYRSYDTRNLPYATATVPLIQFYPYQSTSPTINFYIYNFTQSINKYTVTPYGINNKLGFGFDFPARLTTQNGTTNMISNGQRGTVWVDLSRSSDDTVNYTKYLLSNGFELGVHFTPSLSTVSLEDAYEVIDTNIAMIEDVYGEVPTSWCSLHNSDNVSHAIYAYTNYGMLWRNGRSGVECYSNIGTLDDDYFINFWNTTIFNSGIYPTFTHQVDIDPAIQFSIIPVNFLYFSNTYKQNNINIVGFREYYHNAIIQNESIVNIIESDSDHLTFNMSGIEYPANVLVDISGNAYNTWIPTSSSVFDGGTLLQCEPDTTYTVCTDDYPYPYRPNMTVQSQSGSAPYTVKFIDITTDANSWYWDFENDGTIDSTKQNPAHTYGKAGNYTVNLTVQNEHGNFSTVKTDYITVTTPAFASNPTTWFQWVWSYLSSMFCGMWLSV